MAQKYPNREELIRAHEHGMSAERLHGRIPSEWVRAAVYGANDGIVTTFAVVAGAAGAQLGVRVVLILGLANMIADGISMALGDYLGSFAEMRYKIRQYALEKWEYRQIPEVEKAEIELMYRQKGYSEADAHALVKLLSKQPRHMVDLGFGQEMGALPEDERLIWRTGLVTFLAFVGAGSLPLLPYWFGALSGTEIALDWQLPISAISTAIALFVTGALRALITRDSWIKNGVQVLAVGSLASAASYIVGVWIERLVA